MLTLLLLHATLCATPDNTLTDQEKKDGWSSFFDGLTLDGWTTPKANRATRPLRTAASTPTAAAAT